MSTVLWANYLVDSQVTCAESDLYALCKHADKLDKICRKYGVLPFLDTHDSTDMQFNIGDAEFPEGMESTDEIMAADGTWVDAQAAVEMLETLLKVVREENLRFGVLGNAHREVVAELEESIEFARAAAAKSAKFNFALVM
ncbi:MAG: hypothetical protein QNJ11_00610 [Woeseiaceae bacterium]|nr:hypothetical protein [Woeseiaceae bacterium]